VEILMLAVRPTEEPAEEILPALGLLSHTVRMEVYDSRAPMPVEDPDAVLIDARSELLGARDACRLLRTTGLTMPLLAVVHEAGLVAMSPGWDLDDVVLVDAGPAEVEARLRLTRARVAAKAGAAMRDLVSAGELSINPHTYSARLKGRRLDLTYKEFELLKFLAQHPGRVFTRDRLLREVWGFDYFGGHRTVDVHVRRLRAKLGTEYESMIGTVRQVGYKLVLPPPRPVVVVDEWALPADLSVVADL
jgi:DNA-binding response OmpR family regulator